MAVEVDTRGEFAVMLDVWGLLGVVMEFVPDCSEAVGCCELFGASDGAALLDLAGDVEEWGGSVFVVVESGHVVFLFFLSFFLF